MATLKTCLVLVLLMVGGCVKPPPVSLPARLKVVAEPDVTSVYVNGEYVGRARVLAVKPKFLAPGVKYLTFSADDHFPHDIRLDLPSGETTVKVKLRAVPP